MKIATILGSARPGSYTGKALALVQDELSQTEDVELIIVEPGTMRLAIPGSDMDGSDRDRLQEALREADGVVLSTPEYHGTFSSLLKLTIENMGFPSPLKEKPVIMLGVASGRIGAIKSLEHLTNVMAHVGALALPGSMSVSNVRERFDEDGSCLHTETEKNVRKLAKRLVKYIRDTNCPKRSVEEWARRMA